MLCTSQLNLAIILVESCLVIYMHHCYAPYSLCSFKTVVWCSFVITIMFSSRYCHTPPLYHWYYDYYVWNNKMWFSVVDKSCSVTMACCVIPKQINDESLILRLDFEQVKFILWTLLSRPYDWAFLHLIIASIFAKLSRMFHKCVHSHVLC